MKLNILMLNYEFPPLGGGASPVSYEIAKGYVKLGHSVTVVTMGFKGLPKYEKKDGIKIHRVWCLRSKKEICHPHEMLSYVISAKRFLRKHLLNNRYDINHTHFIIPTGIISLWAKKKFGLKYIITSHGSDVIGYNNDRFNFIHLFTKNMLRKVCDNSNLITTPSNYLKELIRKNIANYSDDKLIKIPNGIDPSIYVPKKKKRIILSTGRLLPRKGFQYLIKAVSNEDIGYEVHICGDGPMMDELKKLAEESKTKIIFHGWIDNNSKEYKDLLGSSSIYVLASLKENASIALLEAMSAGCAVITSNVSGCPETVGDVGLKVNPSDVEDLRRKIYGLIEIPKIIKSLGDKARYTVCKTYDKEIINKEFEKIFGK